MKNIEIKGNYDFDKLMSSTEIANITNFSPSFYSSLFSMIKLIDKKRVVKEIGLNGIIVDKITLRTLHAFCNLKNKKLEVFREKMEEIKINPKKPINNFDLDLRKILLANLFYTYQLRCNLTKIAKKLDVNDWKTDIDTEPDFAKIIEKIELKGTVFFNKYQ